MRIDTYEVDLTIILSHTVLELTFDLDCNFLLLLLGEDFAALDVVGDYSLYSVYLF
mgnify:FL=1